jgi:hypothetical protein
MTLEAFFEDLIKDQAKVVINTSQPKPYVELTEPGQAGCKLKISGIPSDSIVIKADLFPAPDRIFNGNKSECKRADYAIITQKNNNHYVLYIELKSSTEAHSEIESQLKGARCLIGYCAEIAEHFWGEKNILRSCSHRYACFTRVNLRKRKTRIDHQGRNDTPASMLKIDSPHYVEFNKLICA